MFSFSFFLSFRGANWVHVARTMCIRARLCILLVFAVVFNFQVFVVISLVLDISVSGSIPYMGSF